MKRTTTIYKCLMPDCDYWEWGNKFMGADECPECGAPLWRDDELAFDTIACERYHDQRDFKL
jgi:hypothetical protein